MNIFSKQTAFILWAILFSPISSRAATSALPKTGISGGNPIVQADFDFRMSAPVGWMLEMDSPFSKHAMVRSAPVAATWSLANRVDPEAEDASWMQVDFYSAIRVESLEELETYIKQEHPQEVWQNYTDSKLAGYRSNETSEGNNSPATRGRMYFFMDRRMVVSVSWRRHTASNGHVDISNMIQSMDRATAAPILRAIRYSPSDKVEAGKNLCVYLRVDDLKSSFTSSSLESFKFQGISSHKIWEPVVWNESTGEFELCFAVPRHITASDELKLQSLSLENERDSFLNCYEGVPYRVLTCGGGLYSIPQKPPIVENHAVDTGGPIITSLAIDQSDGHVVLRGAYQEDSRVVGGWLTLKQIPGDEVEIFLAPWQFSGSAFEINLDAHSNNGTRRVSEIILDDSNGLATALVDCALVDPARGSCSSGSYSLCDEKGTCSSTSIPVIEYFSSRNNK